MGLEECLLVEEHDACQVTRGILHSLGPQEYPHNTRSSIRQNAGTVNLHSGECEAMPYFISRSDSKWIARGYCDSSSLARRGGRGEKEGASGKVLHFFLDATPTAALSPHCEERDFRPRPSRRG